MKVKLFKLAGHMFVFVSLIMLLLVNIAYGQAPVVVKFFVSNNTRAITLATAYARLGHKAQKKLENGVIGVMQLNHMEQGSYESILGTYQLADGGQITADNSEIFTTSPYQAISTDKAKKLAKRLSKVLHQQSVALFISDKTQGIGRVCVKFRGDKPSIVDLVNTIHGRLPLRYSQAFSLHLQNTRGNIDSVAVNSFEWLGSNLDSDLLAQVFLGQSIASQHGTAYLVYQDGVATKL